MGSTIRWSTNQSFACTQDGDMVQKIIAGDLIIPAGVTITTQYRCKGLHIQVMGNMYLYGTIDMSAKGGNVAGQNVGIEAYSDRNIISLNGGAYAGLPAVRQIPAAGANGGGAATATSAGKSPAFASGNTGSAGTNGQCGGGGSGIVENDAGSAMSLTNRPGGAGTSFSGGPGSGGVVHVPTGSTTLGGLVGANGGAGGAGYLGSGSANSPSGGGSGNPSGAKGNASTDIAPVDGTGCLIIITVIGFLYLANGSIIRSNGRNGSSAEPYVSLGTTFYRGGGGAGSGGGSINLLYGSITNAGVTLQANGGTGGTAYNSATGNGDSYKGKAGDGGAGSIRYNSLRVS